MTTTSRQAHTPGPWTVDAANDRDGKVCIYHPPEDGRVLAQAWPDRLAPTFGEAQAIAMANARLIAKAPELLAALRAFVSTIEATGGAAQPEDGDGVAADPEWLDLRYAYDDAQALLAEIEG